MKPKSLNRNTGAFGESIGEAYLAKLGYRILERNVRSPFGEIDLVADDKGTVVFVEIKTRRNLSYGFPEESVGRRKQKKLASLASWYLMHYPKRNPQVRFDVLSILLSDHKPEIRLIQQAFEV
ncbi:MAG: YraN family protein [Omnitrophica bacterium RIFCSPHIGHO2_02_FULL_49_9]|nr:MAG: YraN family protein [Omnitrophica bacterium RIFCSPHIGHO2_02_FULL_49_9]OGW88835.1 MAG: YraN family protein [Omnitrophica bacterium RIFCSPLOWO2_01_FULL_50_24]